ncbi:MAG: hypothetical protein ABIH23_28730 [bacterium]
MAVRRKSYYGGVPPFRLGTSQFGLKELGITKLEDFFLGPDWVDSVAMISFQGEDGPGLFFKGWLVKERMPPFCGGKDPQSPVTRTTGVSWIEFKGEPESLPFREILRAMCPLVSRLHKEHDFRKEGKEGKEDRWTGQYIDEKGRGWTGLPLYKNCRTGNEILEYIEKESVESGIVEGQLQWTGESYGIEIDHLQNRLRKERERQADEKNWEKKIIEDEKRRIREEKIRDEVRAERRDALFPLGDANWYALKITFSVVGEHEIKVRLQCRGKSEFFSMEELGLEGPRGMNQFGSVLLRYAQNWTTQEQPRLTMETFGAMKRGQVKTIVSGIRKKLKSITGLSSDPFEDGGNTEDGWQLRCTLRYDDSDYVPGGDAMNRHHRIDTPPEVVKRSKDGRTAVPRNPDYK